MKIFKSQQGLTLIETLGALALLGLLALSLLGLGK